ncbi:MAG: citramalate synthase [Gammaproteobacteria bacterium]|nr:citramalate synthase [Gammaproteobacteria bacterium]
MQLDRGLSVYLYDTTLRDGAQTQGIHFSAQDKIQIAQWLDNFGIDFIELGWPGANAVDDEAFEFFSNYPLKTSKLVAFGATCKPDEKAKDSFLLNKLVQCSAENVTLVAKSSRFHIENVLETTTNEAFRTLAESIQFCKQFKKRVWIDFEHFFDGFKEDKALAFDIVKCALDAGAEGIFLCDTNGGCLPEPLKQTVQELTAKFSCSLGVHAHNDCDLGVANGLAALDGGCQIVQGCINGYGERCGNTNLTSLIPILASKTDFKINENINLLQLTELSRKIANRANQNPQPYAPFVGSSAFAHKAGLHASAVSKFSQSYEHIPPESVGNERHILVSNQSGKSNLKHKLKTVNLNNVDKENIDLSKVLKSLKQSERLGFQFEEGDASLELLLKREITGFSRPFNVLEVIENSFVDSNQVARHHVSTKVKINEQVVWSAAEANGPVEALDKSLRHALGPFWPEIENCELADYKVRILDPQSATAATTHVWIQSRYKDYSWSSIGCSESIFLASQQAICDALEYFLLEHSHKFECSQQTAQQSMHSTKSQPLEHESGKQVSRNQKSLNQKTGRNGNGYQAA